MKHIILISALALSGCIEAIPTEQSLTIPTALQGRWGLVAGDCLPVNGDDKGVLVVGQSTLTFYESRATLTQVSQRSSTSISGAFAFTGEGMTWTRQMSLTLQGSEKLVRRESGPDALPAPLTYTKCI